MIDLNDKKAWCDLGLELEKEFVSNSRFSDVTIGMNPSKSFDKYTYDMKIEMPCDLKTITTPWIYSEEMFGIPSDYAISINRKDLRRYYSLYPNIIIIFDVQYENYKATHWSDLDRLRILVKQNKAFLHKYKNRVDDNIGNAKDSYVLDVRKLPILK